MNWQLVNKVTAIYLVLLVLAVIANTLVFALIEYGRKGTEFVGCFAYDAMLIGFECQGFIGSPIVTAWLNLPLWLLFAPVFALSNLRTFLMAILVWAPVAGFIVSTIKLRRQASTLIISHKNLGWTR